MFRKKSPIKTISVVTGLAVLTAMSSLAVQPGKAAEWLTPAQSVQAGNLAQVIQEKLADRLPGLAQTATVALQDTFGLEGTVIKIPVTAISSAVNYKKIDVGPGVVGLDYDKVIKWQQNVDAGRERWRLDPLQVAKMEGRNYGFTDQDSFSISERLEKSELARHGEIHVRVIHNGQEYTMVLVRPFGGGDAIWTTYRVIGYKPVPPAQPAGTTLFATDKYEGWQWRKTSYPKDMAFATIVNYAAQLNQDGRIPANVLQEVQAVDYNNKVVLFAYLGTVPTGGYDIGIEKVSMNANKMTVTIRTKSPAAGAMVTQAITQPADYIALDRAVFDIWGGVDITFVDQTGRVLSKNKLTITHR